MQKKKTTLRVSIVIPAYNEADTLADCLDAIADQDVAPFEVIVVDNKSTDKTAAIARSYPFVKLLSEPRQGVIYARETGFDYAHGDIIGRIDADTILSESWVGTVQKIFETKSVDAVTGRARYHDIAMANTANNVDLVLRRHLARMLGRSVALQGANMAIRKRMWREIKSSLCSGGGMHEDLDLCIHANQRGYNIIFDETMIATIGFRQADSKFVDYVSYLMINPRTYGMHGLSIQRHMYPVIALAIVSYPLINVLHRGYDKRLNRFSFERLLAVDGSARVNPATFVD